MTDKADTCAGFAVVYLYLAVLAFCALPHDHPMMVGLVVFAAFQAALMMTRAILRK